MVFRKLQPYAVTWSPPDIAGKPVLSRYKELVDHFQHWMSMCTSHYILYPEFAGGRLHFHGILYFSDPIKYVKCIQHQICRKGFVLLKEMKSDVINKLNWLNYCKKEWEISRVILSLSRPILWCTYYKQKDNQLYIRTNFRQRVVHRTQLIVTNKLATPPPAAPVTIMDYLKLNRAENKNDTQSEGSV